MTDQADQISIPRLPRARGGDGEAGGDHRRQPGPRGVLARVLRGPAPRWRWWPAPSRTSRPWPASGAIAGGGGGRDRRGLNEAVADAVVAEWGGVDVWICNAGISPIVAGPRQTTASEWARQVLEVNLTGAFLGPGRGPGHGRGRAADLHRLGPGRAAPPGARRLQRLQGRAGGPGQGPGARPGPRGHHRQRGRPGWFDSPLARVEERRRASAAITGHTAQGRWGDPADLTGAYLFLASDASAFVTGTVLSVDGGYLLGARRDESSPSRVRGGSAPRWRTSWRASRTPTWCSAT